MARDPAFTSKARDFLGYQASLYKTILNSHANDSTSKRIKEKTWAKIIHELNSKGFGYKRQPDKVRRYWENMKAQAKKVMSAKKRFDEDWWWSASSV